MSTGNPILDKNLECIAKYNPNLKQKLLNIKELKNDIQVIETNLKEPNLLYNGIPLHSSEGADKEIENAFEKTGNTKRSRHIIFGMGLGYLFKYCCEISKGIVFLYEPNLEILRVTLEIVDFSAELSQTNVFVFSDLNIFAELYKKTCQYKTNAGFFTLNSYRNFLYKDKINDITEKIKDIIFTENGKIEGSKKLIFNLSKSIIQNLPSTFNATLLDQIGEIYKDKTALIISAGPTLDENIEIIKKNRNKFVIFCIGQAIKALNTNGIKPDFLVILEYKDCSGQTKGVDLSDINLILAPYTHPNTYLLNPKKTFLITDTSEVNKFWQTFINKELKYFDVKGTVSYMAMISAQILGCNKIILVGMDLALINNQCYGNDTAYSNLIFEKNSQNEITLKIKDADKHLESLNSAAENVKPVYDKNFINNDIAFKQTYYTFAKGISGEMIPTFVNYASFVPYFSDFAKDNPNLKLINTSMKGLQIDGFENIPLPQALNNLPDIKIQDAASVKSNFDFDKKNILTKLEECKTTMENALKSLNEGEKIIKDIEGNFSVPENFTKFENEIKKLYNITSRIPSMEKGLAVYEKALQNQTNNFSDIISAKLNLIKKLIPIYNKLHNIKSFIFEATSYKEMLEVQFILDTVDLSSIFGIITANSALKSYFANVKQLSSDMLNLTQESYKKIK